MYGTVSRWRVKAGKEEELKQLAQAMMQDRPASSRAVYVYQADADPREFWVCGIFDSREAYAQNAGTPEQNERFTRLRALMDGDPEWHDGEIVVHY
jgi:quinol monooxygenase YgiN